jgi:UDP-glucose 4-epimerase
MKYFVTGGAGFIGREVVRQLLGAGHDVAIYDDFSFGRPANIEEFAKHPRLQVHTGKVEDFRALHACIEGFRPDVTIHLAALHYIPYCNKHPLETIRINVEGAYSVFESCEKAGVGKVVLA